MSEQKFQINDKVKVIADKQRLVNCFADESLTGETGIVVDIANGCLPYRIEINGIGWWLAEQDLELTHIAAPAEPERTFVGHPDGELGVKNADTTRIGEGAMTVFDECSVPFKHTIRTYGTGATRDTDQGKLDYVKALSPIVIRRYVQYLDKHRLQPDGSYRDFDNWKKGIPQGTYLNSLGRHFLDTWLLADGYDVEDNHGPVEEQDALCAIMFNTMGKLHEILKVKVDRTKPDLRMKP